MSSKGSDQTARILRLVSGFAGRTYHIVGNLMLRLNYVVKTVLTCYALIDSSFCFDTLNVGVVQAIVHMEGSHVIISI